MKSLLYVTIAQTAIALFLINANPSAALSRTPSQEETEPVGTDMMDPEVATLIDEAMRFVADLKSFSFEAQATYDVVQFTGIKLQFAHKQTVDLERPDHLRARFEFDDGRVHTLYHDGTNITLVDESDHLFARSPAPDRIDDAVSFALTELQIRVPLAELVFSDIHETLVARFPSGFYAGLHAVAGMPCHHVVLSNENVDVQLWLQSEGDPLLRKLLITYKQEDGLPQFSAVFEKWNVSPTIAASVFAFTPGTEDEEIEFVATLAATGDEEEAGR